ncbi:hypothetical protein GCM10023066_27980 [Nocardioides kongjuensis]
MRVRCSPDTAATVAERPLSGGRTRASAVLLGAVLGPSVAEPVGFRKGSDEKGGEVAGFRGWAAVPGSLS